jgi:hypothetical protein
MNKQQQQRRTANSKRKNNNYNRLRYTNPLENRLYRYFDADTDLSISTVPTQNTLLGQLLTTNVGILPKFPSLWNPATSGNDPMLTCDILITRIDIRAVFVGAQSNALLAGDLYNSIRLLVWLSGRPFGEATANPLTDIIKFIKPQEALKVYLDYVAPLPTMAFDSQNGYNAPQVIHKAWSINTNIHLPCYTETDTGTSGWTTKQKNLAISAVSDSSVAPHPVLNFSARMYYTVLHR